MSKPKILCLDIETAPALVYAWGLFDQNIGLNQIVSPGRTIMVGAKWFGEKGIMQWDEFKDGSTKMFSEVREVLTDADAVVTFNGDRFDLPRLKGHIIENRLQPVPPLSSIDLLKTVRKMGLQSNKLAYVSEYLGIGQKVKNEGFPLWKGCMDGDGSAWKKMRTYNKGDVLLTERLYDVLRPHIGNHPYLGARQNAAIKDSYECPHCHKVTMRYQKRGYQRTRTTCTPRIQCLECGGWGRGKQEKVL